MSAHPLVAGAQHGENFRDGFGSPGPGWRDRPMWTRNAQWCRQPGLAHTVRGQVGAVVLEGDFGAERGQLVGDRPSTAQLTGQCAIVRQVPHQVNQSRHV